MTAIDGIYKEDNIFAQILRGEAPAIKVFEDEEHLAFMDIFPESKGHVLVIPKVASRNFLDFPSEKIGGYMACVQKIAAAVKVALNPDGLRIMQYNGAAATQTVFHLHFHIVPCYEGVELATHSGQMADMEELEAIAQKIRAALK